MSLSFQVEPWATTADELKPWLIEHWAEVDPNQDTVPLSPDWPRLAAIDEAGGLVLLTVRDGAALVGYMIAFLSPHVHYSTTLFAFVDAFWIHPLHRRANAGIRLFTEAEAVFKARGVVKVIAQTKVRDDINIRSIYKWLGWSEAETVFAKVI